MKKPSEYLTDGLAMPFSENILRAIDRSAQVVALDRGTTLLCQGEKPSYVYFICKGLMRGYFIDAEGNDMTKCFAKEGEFACTEGLRNPGAATFSIETLEESHCIKIPYHLIHSGVKEDDTILQLINYYTQRALKTAEKREAGLLTQSAAKRYKDFLWDEPELAKRLSQRHLASYLGIRPGSLCRIKQQLAQSSPM